MSVAEVPLPAGLLTVDQAVEAVLAAVTGPLDAEDVAVADLHAALGRALGAPVAASTDLPPWDNSAMDGYAVRAMEVASATERTPVRLEVVGEVAAGAAPIALPAGSGAAIRIATGAPIPDGADAVVPVELTTALGPDGATVAARGGPAVGPLPAAVLVHEAVAAGGSVRARGEDVRRGTTVLEAGAPLTAAAIALAAGAGASRLRLVRRPRVGVLATGDELRAAGTDLGQAGIPDANGPGLRALVRAAGGEPVDLGVAADRLDDVVGRLERGLEGSGGRPVDAVVVSGGVSVGPYDVVREAFGRLGRVDLWRVAVQPGKPFAFGLAAGGRPLFGLPGNPVSTFITFELFVRPAIRQLAGLTPLERSRDRAVLDGSATSGRDRRTFLRVAAVRDGDGSVSRDGAGRAIVRLAGGQGSHVLSALAAADALAIVPEEVTSVDPGTELELWWLDR
ncbi:MAG TPA: gephyrin-like molybdotransferase Glp [Candidatus Limnocylindrales bacterium]|nr:gephyrin-like molybdotransferase Glp [Candidatus Limnocylindrales bacterium]